MDHISEQHFFGVCFGALLKLAALEIPYSIAVYDKMTKKSKGALRPFMEGKWKLAYLKDPDGNWIELGERIKKQNRKKLASSA